MLVDAPLWCASGHGRDYSPVIGAHHARVLCQPVRFPSLRGDDRLAHLWDNLSHNHEEILMNAYYVTGWNEENDRIEIYADSPEDAERRFENITGDVVLMVEDHTGIA